MFKNICLSILLLGSILLTNINPVFAQTMPSGQKEDMVMKEVDNLFKTNENNGLAVTIFKGEDTIYEEYRGFANKEKNVVIDKDTVLEWGSITKLLVWVSVMQLQEVGKLDINQDIRAILPEDFFQKLAYDEPITLIDLMNHQGGWQEKLVGLFTSEEILPLEDALIKMEPPQIERPGVVSAYSNWGVALAGLIVEKVSGQTFAEYVKENIFNPLNMQRTALLPDLSDNKYVKEKRSEIEGYLDTDRVIDVTNTSIPLYPAGQATGTLDDITRFAKALADNSSENKLFLNQDTIQNFYDATLTYNNYGFSRNSHGMWVSHFSVPTYGHSGGTVKFMSNLLVDPISGYGYVVMTNNRSSVQEGIIEIPQILFGKNNSNTKIDFVDKEKFELEDGYYVGGRFNFREGFMKMGRVLLMEKISKINENTYQSKSLMDTPMITKNDFGFFEYSSAINPQNKGLIVGSQKLEDGRYVLQMNYGDTVQVPTKRAILDIIMFIVFLMVILYGVVAFLWKIQLLIVLGIKKLFKKEIRTKSLFVKKLNRLELGIFALTVLFIVNVLALAINVMIFSGEKLIPIQLKLNIAIVIALLALAIVCVLRCFKIKDTEKEDFKLGLCRKLQMCLVIVIPILTTITVIYWELFF